jgi:colicin import membrane protein
MKSMMIAITVMVGLSTGCAQLQDFSKRLDESSETPLERISRLNQESYDASRAEQTRLEQKQREATARIQATPANSIDWSKVPAAVSNEDRAKALAAKNEAAQVAKRKKEEAAEAKAYAAANKKLQDNRDAWTAKIAAAQKAQADQSQAAAPLLSRAAALRRPCRSGGPEAGRACGGRRGGAPSNGPPRAGSPHLRAQIRLPPMGGG